jgi:hypothetical protein
VEPGGDLGVAVPGRELEEHVVLAWGQLGQERVAGAGGRGGDEPAEQLRPRDGLPGVPRLASSIVLP